MARYDYRGWTPELDIGVPTIDTEKHSFRRGKKMTDLRRKLIALFSALVILAAAVTITGCGGGEEEPAPTPPAEEPAE